MDVAHRLGIWRMASLRRDRIMEHVGYNPGSIHISTHCEAYYWLMNNQKTAIKTVEDPFTVFTFTASTGLLKDQGIYR
jgi:hypothetical protein